MLTLILKKELREILGSTKFGVTFLVCASLILLSFYVGARNYHLARTQHEAALAENLRQMEGLTDWLRATQRIFLAPSPLAALVTGVSNDIGRNVQVQQRGDLTAEDSRFNDDPIFAMFRFLDLEFVFQIVLSLFAILFAYNAISGEKEQGTLRLSFSNAVPRATYILGKAAGLFLALAVPLLLPVLLGSLIYPLLGISMGSEEWSRLALVVLCGMLLLGAFLMLSLFVSCLTQRSASSFLILLVAWVLAVLIIPRTAVLLAGRAVEVMSSDEISFQQSRYRAQLWEEDKAKMSEFKPKRENPREMMKEFQLYMQEVSDEREARFKEFADRLAEQRRNQEMAQRRLAFGLARISPVAAFSLASMSLTGTSLELKERYQRQAESYRSSYAEFVKGKTGGLTSGGLHIRVFSDEQKEPEPIDPREIPAFEYQAEPLSEVVRIALFDMGVLSVFNLVFFASAFVAFLRYDVR